MRSGETPPLTRGRLIVRVFRRLLFGNTPAYAGKTGTRYTEILRAQKHPRLRGEDKVARPRKNPQGKHPRLRGEDRTQEDYDPIKEETPPLTRGRRASMTPSRARSRNTPAYAGKTFNSS